LSKTPPHPARLPRSSKISDVKHFFPVLFLLTVLALPAQAQQPGASDKSPHLIQLSGLLLTDAGNQLVPVPYATVHLPGKGRGTYTDYRGFFTLVVEKGDRVRFNVIGFQPVTFTVPDTLTQDRYSWVQLITQDTINLPEAIIFPWPSKEHFKLEFLKMDVTPELQRRATENLANEYLAEARKNDKVVPYNGPESANFYLRQQAREYVYIGQTPPMNIFSPLAWAKFFQSWKNGDYKKKKKE
jgi:hypothetical protein